MRRVGVLCLVLGLAVATFAVSAGAGASSSATGADEAILAQRVQSMVPTPVRVASPGAGTVQAQATPGAVSVSAVFTVAFTDEPAVDVYFDGELFLEGATPGDSYDLLFEPNDVQVDITPAGSATSLPGFPVVLAVAPFADDVVGIVAHYDGGVGTVTIFDLATDAAANQLPNGVGTLQTLQAAGVGPLDVYLNGAVQSPTLATGESATYNRVNDFYDFLVTPNLTGPSGSPSASDPETPIAQGWLTVFVLMSDQSGSTLEIAPYALRVGSSYSLIAADGGVFAFGDAVYRGSLGGTTLNKPVIAGASTRSGLGYWLVAQDGGIFTFGDAEFFGSTGGLTLNSPVITMIPTPSGDGYWLLAADGGVFSFGDAQFFGSTGNLQLNKPIVSGVATPSGLGYWIVASDGGIFSFGDAAFFGSTGDLALNAPVIGIAAAPLGLGYFLVARDGGVFTFGAAEFYGSAVGTVRGDVVALATTPSERGYWVATTVGEVRNFGDATFDGDLSGSALNAPIISIFS